MRKQLDNCIFSKHVTQLLWLCVLLSFKEWDSNRNTELYSLVAWVYAIAAAQLMKMIYMKGVHWAIDTAKTELAPSFTIIMLAYISNSLHDETIYQDKFANIGLLLVMIKYWTLYCETNFNRVNQNFLAFYLCTLPQWQFLEISPKKIKSCHSSNW